MGQLFGVRLYQRGGMFYRVNALDAPGYGWMRVARRVSGRWRGCRVSAGDRVWCQHRGQAGSVVGGLLTLMAHTGFVSPLVVLITFVASLCRATHRGVRPAAAVCRLAVYP